MNMELSRRGFVKSDRRGITVLLRQVVGSNPAAPTKDNQPKNRMIRELSGFVRGKGYQR
jgi:hypothetical protein